MSSITTGRDNIDEEHERKKRLYNMPETSAHENELDDEGDDGLDNVLTKGEARQIFEQMFWEQSRKKEGYWESEGPMMWQREQNQQQELCRKAEGELKDLMDRRSPRQTFDYQKALTEMMQNQDCYSAEERQNLVDQAFAELCGAAHRSKMLTKDESAIAASRNIRARGKFFRGAQ